MSLEYLVLQADAEQGPFVHVRAHQLNQSWGTRQEVLDELGQHAWDLYTTIDSATKERRGPGEHDGEGCILKRTSYTARERVRASESRPQARAF
jgi:hypothetical protein